MRQSLFLVITLFLTSCIDVENFGTYWSKTSLDTSTEGTWTQLALATNASQEDSGDVGEEVRVVPTGNAYQISGFKDGRPDGEPATDIKVLHIGTYTFFVQGPQKGSMVRYKIEGDTLTTYFPNADAVEEFVATTDPGNTNISEDTSSADDRYLKINTLNERVFKVLSAIPDNAGYWRVQAKYVKRP